MFCSIGTLCNVGCIREKGNQLTAAPAFHLEPAFVAVDPKRQVVLMSGSRARTVDDADGAVVEARIDGEAVIGV